MPFVSITRLRIRSRDYVDLFAAALPGVYAQAAEAPGNLGMDLLADANDTFWTKSVWTDRDAMRGYMTSGDHGDVMPHLRDWCDEAHVAHWDQEGDELPTWEEAHRRIVADGRTSTVAHPSPDHAIRTVAAPVVD
jgi:heme-degrading monooxygenase HmoA